MAASLTISKRFTFEASHVLPKHPGQCSRMHGHSWGLVVSVRGPLDPETGFVCDYSELSRLVKHSVIDKLDHRHLGQGVAVESHRPNHIGTEHFPPFGVTFYPTSENLARAIGKLLAPLIQEITHGLTLASIVIEETCTSACTWRPEDES